jgi:AraC-like DNA-binding protein
MNTRLNYVKDWQLSARKANWSVETLAKHCGVSTRTLRRFFLKTEGKSVKAWLDEQRQKLASELLSEGSSVKEIASQVGYAHPETLSRQYKRFWGKCPTQPNEVLPTGPL